MSNKSNIIKCPNCGNLNYDLCIICQFCSVRFEKTKEDCEKLMDKIFGEEWRNSWVNMIWNRMEGNQVFYLDENFSIIKYNDTYRIIEGDYKDENQG